MNLFKNKKILITGGPGSIGQEIVRPFDVVDDLTTPLILYTDKDFEDLGFNPPQPDGYFDIESRMI